MDITVEVPVAGTLLEDEDPESRIGEAVDYDLFDREDQEDPGSVEEDPAGARAAYHLAPTLKVLRDEVDRRWPKRDRTSDGWIGDAAHRGTRSDHNPDADNGSVNALDIDRDGIDPMLVVRRCIAHPSTQYVIFDRTIWSRTRNFAAARYTGSNPHDKHLHVSVSHDRALENSTRSWGIADAVVPKLGDRVLRRGSTGSDVRELQTLAGRLGAKLAVDGDFGSRTEAWVRDFQKAQRLTVDGIVGPRTLAALRAATAPTPAPATPSTGPKPGSRTVRRGSTGADVAFVQRFVGERRCGPATGSFDAMTESGVQWYQGIRGITVDGVVGPQTWRQMGVQVTY
ncbi:hypothetical protein AWW66_00690 [Micromonospora rosaria]|uniref:Peptidoglycan binding-like domain-containing protein n=1 Tax=Micromonospora rosaria TaxID=47874 RepID=A0A136PZW4_9ACTN|nr:peptidoglycan-binding protein [Micromonospora rosaria]KXK63989.1 hypothetical protein AWW66_00690 [Micromonospora rosaria]